MKGRGRYVALLLAGGLAACCFSCRSRGAAAHLPGTVLEVSDSSILSLRRDTFDLGRLREGERIVKEFSVKNSGDVPFVVSSAESDCGCIVSEYDRRPVAPGEYVPLGVSFDSRGYRGYMLKRVVLTTTLRREPLVFYLEAVVE